MLFDLLYKIKLMKYFKQILIGFIFISTIVACKKDIEPSFQRLENIDFNRKDGKMQIAADVVMYNPNSVGITVSKSTFDIQINEKNIGNVVQTIPFKVKAKQEFSIPIKYIFEPDEVLKNLFLGGLGSMFRSKEAQLKIKGTVTIKAVKKEFKVPVKASKVIDLKIKRE